MLKLTTETMQKLQTKVVISALLLSTLTHTDFHKWVKKPHTTKTHTEVQKQITATIKKTKAYTSHTQPPTTPHPDN